MSAEKKFVSPLERIGSKYKLVIIGARRALDLSEGAPKLVETDSRNKPAVVALQEIAEGKIGLRPKNKGKEKEKD